MAVICSRQREEGIYLIRNCLEEREMINELIHVNLIRVNDKGREFSLSLHLTHTHTNTHGESDIDTVEQFPPSDLTHVHSFVS